MSKKKKDDCCEEADCGVKDISDALEQLDECWPDADEQKFGEIPNDSYQVKIDKVFLNKAKSSGRFQCTWEVTIIAGKETKGKLKGRKVFFRDGLDNQQSIGYFKGQLAPLGIEYPKKKPSKVLPGLLEELEGTYAQLRLRQSGDFTNGHFEKALDSCDVDEVEDGDDCEDEKPKKKGKKDCCECEECCCCEDEKPKKKKKGKDDDCEDCDDCEKPKKKDKGKKDCEDDEEEEGVEATFEEDDLKKDQLKQVKKWAKSAELDPDDYDDNVDLISDVAEYYGVSGKFSKVKKLMAAIEAKVKKDDDEDCEDCDD